MQTVVPFRLFALHDTHFRYFSTPSLVGVKAYCWKTWIGGGSSRHGWRSPFEFKQGWREWLARWKDGDRVHVERVFRQFMYSSVLARSLHSSLLG